ncbi:hypothetical protein LguiB_029117 [Lonicera macranthoides]
MMSLSMSIDPSSDLTVFSVNNLFYSSKPKPQFPGIRIPQVCPKPISSIRASPKNSASLVVMMAKERRRIEQTRLKTTEQINEEIIDLKGELFMLQSEKAEDGHQFNIVPMDIVVNSPKNSRKRPRNEVVFATPKKLIFSNYKDSRAILCHKGIAILLSSDHNVNLVIQFHFIHCLQISI